MKYSQKFQIFSRGIPIENTFKTRRSDIQYERFNIHEFHFQGHRRLRANHSNLF